MTQNILYWGIFVVGMRANKHAYKYTGVNQSGGRALTFFIFDPPQPSSSSMSPASCATCVLTHSSII
jgi:hypothetical protein